MGNQNNANLVLDALTMVIGRRKPTREVIIHSDQGSAYALGSYQQQLKENQFRCSMSRKDECLDNAVVESFFGTLKNELIYHEDYRTKAQARLRIFE